MNRPPGGRSGPVAVILVAASLTIASGCGRGDGLGRRPISGTVTLDATPIDRGTILFEPAPGDESGTSVGGLIRKGRFSIPEADGPVPGIYRVRIYASSRVQEAPEPGGSPEAPRPMVDLIPNRYNKESRLEVDVRARGANEFPFELQTGGTSADVLPD